MIFGKKLENKFERWSKFGAKYGENTQIGPKSEIVQILGMGHCDSEYSFIDPSYILKKSIGLKIYFTLVNITDNYKSQL